MKKGWVEKKFKDCLKLRSGESLVSSKMNQSGEYPVFGGNGIAGMHDMFNISGSNVIIGRVGALCGNVRYINEQIWLTDNAFKVIDLELQFDKPFLTYLLNFKNLRTYARQAAQPVISNSSLEDILLQFPTNIAEQQAIVVILDEAFAAIEKAKQNTERNLQNARELFQSYLDATFTSIIQSSNQKCIKELGQVIGGFSFKSNEFKKAGKYQVIRIGNVRPGLIRENESPVFIDNVEDKVLSRALLLPADVVITQTGTKKKRDYGYTAIVDKSNLLLNQRVAAIRFTKDYLPKFFLYFSWTNHFKDQYFANETGTVGQGNVGITAITDAKVPFVSIKQQQIILTQLDELREETQKLGAIYQKKLDDLEELKKSILQKAFSGELKSTKTQAV